jgi:phosphatidylglycerophosphate synthase
MLKVQDMIDAQLIPLLGPPLDRAARALERLGLTANAVTAAGAMLGLGACAAIAFEAYGLGLMLILANRLLDGLDGALARRTGATDLGGFIDLVADFLFYSAVPFAFALAEPERALAAAFLIFSFVGTAVSFLAFAAIAARRGLASERHGPKSVYYLGGLTEGAETILLFVLMALKPHWFEALAYGFGALCWITTAGRVWSGAVLLRNRPESAAHPAG